MIYHLELKYSFHHLRILDYQVSNWKILDNVKSSYSLSLDGKRHNGCVRVDDVGYGLDNDHIDFYVLRKSNYEKLANRVNHRVDIHPYSNCVIKNYEEEKLRINKLFYFYLILTRKRI